MPTRPCAANGRIKCIFNLNIKALSIFCFVGEGLYCLNSIKRFFGKCPHISNPVLTDAR